MPLVKESNHHEIAEPLGKACPDQGRSVQWRTVGRGAPCGCPNKSFMYPHFQTYCWTGQRGRFVNRRCGIIVCVWAIHELPFFKWLSAKTGHSGARISRMTRPLRRGMSVVHASVGVQPQVSDQREQVADTVLQRRRRTHRVVIPSERN